MHILLIEDQAHIARFMALGLRAEGMHCRIARDGDSGLQRALSEAQAVIILDRKLPGMDGLTLCRQLRTRGRRTPVLMLSAVDDIEGRRAAYRAGVDDYLVKPFDFDVLLARLRALHQTARAIS